MTPNPEEAKMLKRKRAEPTELSLEPVCLLAMIRRLERRVDDLQKRVKQLEGDVGPIKKIGGVE